MFKSLFKDLFTYLVLSLATFLLLRTIIGYANFDTNYAFLAKKQEYLNNRFWLFCFYTHVFCSIFTLLAGFTQFSNHLLKNNRKLHRALGKIYIVFVLFINFPAGLVMAYYANGHLPSKIAFFILDILWFYFTLTALRKAKSKELKEHKYYMIRSYALTFSAITLRTWKIILAPIILNQEHLYMVDAWMGFVPNLLLAEIIIYKIKR